YIAGVERQAGESGVEAVMRGLKVSREEVPYGIPLAGSVTEHIGNTGKAYVAQNLERERPYPEDPPLHQIGVRAYVRTPLRTGAGLIGAMVISRMTAKSFSPEEVELLEDVSPPIALAVANSFAYEEIRRLKDRLAAENQVLREEIDRESMFEEIVGASRALRAVLDRVEKVAATESTVLVTGETGTGKELVARAIHRRSPRADRALIKVNCAALPAGLIASELFGHEKGAFTGALQQRSGRFELANGGSIFLDEVGELPPDVQASLLRVIQEGEFERVGGSRTLVTDVRVIAATNRDLGRAVAQGSFRSDLFYRLNVFPIEMPALRQRTEDVPVLVEYFTTRFASRMGKKIRAVDRDSMRRLVAYAWPG
ncbi:MAG: sigma 54-interacting transcriptional regulator, partial [Candidatus Binatia bacterium]